MTIDRQTPYADLPPLMSPREVAAWLGIGRDCAYRLVKDGTLPAVTVNGWRRVPRHALQEWLKRCGQTTRPAPAPAGEQEPRRGERSAA